ncbi:hypothetical protein LLE87_38910, partial [Paenibacillus polymyxa]|nr:hypothetical protein [Paenibacillus polymyxa]
FDGIDMQAEDTCGHGGDGSTGDGCRREYKKCGTPGRLRETKKARDKPGPDQVAVAQPPTSFKVSSGVTALNPLRVAMC